MSDPAAAKQRWYCCVCNVRYRTGFGMLMEIHATAAGASAFVRASVTDHDVEDLRGTEIEEKLMQPTAFAAQ